MIGDRSVRNTPRRNRRCRKWSLWLFISVVFPIIFQSLGNCQQIMASNISLMCVSVIVVVASLSLIQADDSYTTKWDNINVDEILGSDRLLKNYFKCLNDEGSCTAEAADLKKNLQEALTTDCSKCSDKQKENIEKVINYLHEKKTEMWTALQDKYDPEKIYYNKHFA